MRGTPADLSFSAYQTYQLVGLEAGEGVLVLPFDETVGPLVAGGAGADD